MLKIKLMLDKAPHLMLSLLSTKQTQNKKGAQMNTEDVTDPLELDDIEAGRLAETQAENSSRAEPVEEEEPHMLRILDPMNRADLGAIAINLRLRDFAFTAREEFESNPAEHKKYLFLKEGKLAPHI